MAVVKFHSIDVNTTVKDKNKLKHFIKYIFSSEQKKLAAVDFIFCGDEYLLLLNQQFLQHDYYTDILTFDLSGGTVALTGEIYISTDRVAENAVSHNCEYLEELRRIIVHGILHLCGYLDGSEEEKGLMTQRENFYLEQFKAFHVETK